MFELKLETDRTKDFLIWESPPGHSIGKEEIIEWIKEQNMIVKIRVFDAWNLETSYIVKYNKFKLEFFNGLIMISSFIFYSEEDRNLFKLTWI